MYLNRFLMSVKGIFKLIILISNNINILISRGVLVLLTSVITSLITVSNTYKRTFI